MGLTPPQDNPAENQSTAIVWQAASYSSLNIDDFHLYTRGFKNCSRHMLHERQKAPHKKDIPEQLQATDEH